ncbi:MAG: hypothetical protein ACXWRE_08365 [Pseudobdellovibrionaceae bacterium]
MKNKLKTITVSGALILGQGNLPNNQKGTFDLADLKDRSYFFKEELETLGLASNATFYDVNGNSRLLAQGEQVEVKKHEEEGIISFTTFDKYSVRVRKELLNAPRNVSGETHF